MQCANQHNLVRCSNCDAIYDKTIQWVRGRYDGTSSTFRTSSTVRENSCPICGKKHD